MTFFGSDKKSADGPPSYPDPPPINAASSSSNQPPHNQFGVAFACLLLSRSDRVRLIGFSPDVIPAVDMAIGTAWPVGIQKKGEYEGGGYEWKLSGRPCKSLPVCLWDTFISRLDMCSPKLHSSAAHQQGTDRAPRPCRPVAFSRISCTRSPASDGIWPSPATCQRKSGTKIRSSSGPVRLARDTSSPCRSTRATRCA